MYAGIICAVFLLKPSNLYARGISAFQIDSLLHLYRGEEILLCLGQADMST